ncbi:MAG: porin, partial [Oxalobacter sp.]|nr:porin [Oxalobacter sp.]
MKKTLLAAVLSGLLSAAAYAQSSVNIYGILDTGLIKESGSDVRMGDYMSSRIGFRGTEDLGNGLKATFELEQRFRLNDGTPSSSYSWDEKLRNRLGRNDDTRWTGYANVGLAGQWGAVRLGRVMSLVAETFTMIDPFDQNGIA